MKRGKEKIRERLDGLGKRRKHEKIRRDKLEGLMKPRTRRNELGGEANKDQSMNKIVHQIKINKIVVKTASGFRELTLK